ncbi:hypothetical protein [Burkholderia ubonensis]|uniref:hypothetical protein n=1 Tax=Burkholderia ubonensis TaxID=101571 RepID=UPI0012F7B26C|nr:hypothetical protein [Burkholderia ubonensis]
MNEQHLDLGKISGKLGGKRGVWVNQCHEIGGEPATRECFIKKTDGSSSSCVKGSPASTI